jgi:hypothetical protein
LSKRWYAAASLTFGAHGFGPELFARIHVFSFDRAEANVTYA